MDLALVIMGYMMIWFVSWIGISLFTNMFIRDENWGDGMAMFFFVAPILASIITFVVWEFN